MDNIEEILFQIISNAGEARSLYVEAIKDAMKKDFIKAEERIKRGRELLAGSHHIHFDLIQQEINGSKVEVGLLIIHAEDIMMSAETLGILAETMLDGQKMEVKWQNEKA